MRFMEPRGAISATILLRRTVICLAAMAAAALVRPPSVSAQQVLNQAESVVSIPRGGSALLTRPTDIERISIADPNIADAVSVSNREILINGMTVGTTSLMVWAADQPVRMFSVEVTADVAGLERQLAQIFPTVPIQVASTGSALILSGSVRDPSVVRRAMELAETAGAAVINNIQAPAPEQILLHVQFAEVTHSVIKELAGELIQVFNAPQLDHAFDHDDESFIETMAEGFVSLSVMGDQAGLNMVIRALKGTGEFKSLAEPNLVTLEGQEATFLAGGEFPFPITQGGNLNAIVIQWKEFGIRLHFTPFVTNSGNIRLSVAPEVSALDFANGLTLNGFEVPSLVTRRVETEVELAPTQTLAIGGLMDNRLLDQVDKIPLLGDIPILGAFFRSKAAREDRTELLVLVTPYIVDPTMAPPELPTGEWETWEWDGYMKPEEGENTNRLPADTQRPGGPTGPGGTTGSEGQTQGNGSTGQEGPSTGDAGAAPTPAGGR